MMDDQQYLVFRVSASKYALPTQAVREILRLPALMQEVEAPQFVAGLANIRGRIVPVIDLDLRLGRGSRPYRASDAVVISEHEGIILGIIVHDVEDVMTLHPGAMSDAPTYAHPHGPARIVTSIAKSGDDLIMLLDLAQMTADDDDDDDDDDDLAALSEGTIRARVVTSIASSGDDVSTLLDLGPLTADDDRAATRERTSLARKARWAEVEPTDMAILKERARALASATEAEDVVAGTPLAVVAIGGEQFGIDLAVVQEFTDIREITPLPCTPSHMAGLMNLRGDTLALFDVRVALRMPPRADGRLDAKAIVVRVDDATHGVVVDDVLDVIYARADDIAGVPVAGRGTGRDHLRGSLRQGDQILTIIDLKAILRDETFTINEKV